MIKALILTGGKSSRMGTDKFLMKVNEDKPQYLFIYEMLTTLGVEVYFSCTSEQSKEIGSQYNTIVDKYDGIGPIGGIASAVLTDNKTSWLVVACDLINLTPDALNVLLSANDDRMYDIVTYGGETDGFLETTLTIYNPGAFIVIKRKVRDQQYKLQELMKKCTVKAIKPVDKKILRNANTPEDLT